MSPPIPESKTPMGCLTVNDMFGIRERSSFRSPFSPRFSSASFCFSWEKVSEGRMRGIKKDGDPFLFTPHPPCKTNNGDLSHKGERGDLFFPLRPLSQIKAMQRPLLNVMIYSLSTPSMKETMMLHFF